MNQRHACGYKLNTYLSRVMGRRRRLHLRETSAWVRWSSRTSHSRGCPCLHCVLLARARAGALGDGAEPVLRGFAFAHVDQRNFSFDGRGATMGVKTRYRHRRAYLCKYLPTDYTVVASEQCVSSRLLGCGGGMRAPPSYLADAWVLACGASKSSQCLEASEGRR